MLRNLLTALFFLAGANLAQADILIGVAGPLTGQFGSLGIQMRVGVEAAAKAINDAGGINGEPLSVLALDDACDTRRAVEAAQEFIAKDARAVIGHYCSGTSLAAALIYKDRGIVMITPSATAPQLTDARHSNVFRLTNRDDAIAVQIMQRIKALAGPQRVVFVGDGQLASEAFLAAAVSIVPDIDKLTFKSGAANLAKLRQDLQRANPTIVILGLAGAEAARMAALLDDITFTGHAFGGEQLLTEDFTTKIDNLTFEVSAIIPADPVQNQLAAPVVAALTLTGHEPDGAALPAYAATEVIVAAAKATSINDGKAMAQWLRNGQTVETSLGKISFDAKGDLINPAFTWYRWNGAAKRFLPE